MQTKCNTSLKASVEVLFASFHLTEVAGVAKKPTLSLFADWILRWSQYTHAVCKGCALCLSTSTPIYSMSHVFKTPCDSPNLFMTALCVIVIVRLHYIQFKPRNELCAGGAAASRKTKLTSPGKTNCCKCYSSNQRGLPSVIDWKMVKT